MTSRTSPLRSLAGISSPVWGYLRGRVTIDARSLALFRVLVALLVVADLLLRARNFSFYYTDDGAVPQSIAMDATPDHAFSVYYLTTDATLIAALFVLQGLIALQLLVGYRTRIAIVLSFLFVVSLDHHNPFVLSYADVLFRLLLFWAIFLPLGERWSVDAVHRDRPPRDSVANLATAAILLQMVAMYVVNGYHKSRSELWTGGEATPLVFGLDNTTFLLGDLLRNVPTLLQYGGLTWYYMLLFAWLLLVLPGRLRTLFVATFVGGHAAFAVTVRIGAFPYVAIAGLIPFLQARFWEDGEIVLERLPIDGSGPWAAPSKLERAADTLPDVRFDGERLLELRRAAYHVVLVAVVLSVLLTTAAPAIQSVGVVDEGASPHEDVETVEANFGVTQPEWSIFAPEPRTTDRYYVFPAETTGGDYVDVYNDRELTYERPYDELQKQYDTYRERFYMTSVHDGDAQVKLAEYLCEEWRGADGAELVRVNMYLVTESVTLETIDDPEERDRSTRLLYRHGCGDAEPRDIDPPDF